MRHPLSLAALLVAVCLTSMVRADGLMYRLPEDGASAQFNLEFTAGPTGIEKKGTGEIRISSVGETVFNNEKCRWLEFRFTLKMEQQDQERLMIAKLLIPEKHLGKGQSPGENVVRGWFKQGTGEVQELNDLKQLHNGPLLAFLSGPFKDAKELEKIEVDGILGKLACAGQTGRNDAAQDNVMATSEFENRLHEKAPFGLVTSNIKIEVRKNGQLQEIVNISLKLTDVGTTALSELPDRK